ncbi:RGCVC family protein [Saccharothrix luteola]|uniref:RGCVC family protein n=1 Tax=Saccharothrix luteola TaxID=2893018 RepID=UPI0035572C69
MFPENGSGILPPAVRRARRQRIGHDASTTRRTDRYPADAHDALAQRFCAATRAGDLHRGCLCSTESSAATYGKSGQANVSDRA